MKNYIQYFNCEKMGRFPNGADALLTQRMGVFTKLASVKEATGGTVYVLTGLGKPKRYYLWEAFTIDDVQFDGTQYTVSGPGWVLLPPQVLEGKDFDKFKASCANFVSFRAIDDLPYKDTLRKLADQFHLPAVSGACEDFCTELIKMLPKNGDAYYYRGTVRQWLGKTDGAREDFTRAVQLGTNFPQEAAAAMEAPSAAPAATPPTARTSTTPLAAQVVAKGVFAQQAGKKPAGVSDVTWRAVVQRRGQEDLRQKLLQAYGGRCAITNHSGEPALEAAFLVGDAASGPQEVSNSVLLRADVRTLFELNLIRIHPKTGVVIVADELRRTNYGRLHARRLRLPEKKEERPSREALQQRWEASGGTKK
jgi:hypothetical protein